MSTFLSFQVSGMRAAAVYATPVALYHCSYMGLNKNVAILRYDLSVPVRCLFPFINSKASPSDYIYSSELKPSENEPFHCQKALTDISTVNLLMAQ